MPVKFLDDEAIADIAFIINENTLERLFITACQTIFELQTDTNLLDTDKEFSFDIREKSIERLLYSLLSEIIYLKDAELFFAKHINLEISDNWRVHGKFIGTEININKHTIGNDIKAITFHDFYVRKINNEWEAYILVDI